MSWKFWSGHRDRLVLALVGMMVLSLGLSAMSTITESITGTVVRTYEQTWRAPYDILVHAPLAQRAELPDLTEPNVLTSLPAGISRADLAKVRAISGVDVAAPVAPVGYVNFGPTLRWPLEAGPGVPKEASSPEPGTYQLVEVAQTDQTAFPEHGTLRIPFEVTRSNSGPVRKPDGTIIQHPNDTMTLGPSFHTLMVGVDPVSEAKLVGLDQALINGRYFQASDSVLVDHQQEGTTYSVPVLLNPQGFAGVHLEYRVEQLDAKGQPVHVIYRQQWSDSEMVQVAPHQLPFDSVGYQLDGTVDPLTYRLVASPYPQRWPTAAELTPAAPDEVTQAVHRPYSFLAFTTFQVGPTFRTWRPLPVLSAEAKIVSPQVLGVFDPTKLDVAKNPDTQLPLMNYRPAEALDVLDAAGRAVNPPRVVRGGLGASGFLGSPPVLVTTLDAALQVAGDHAITAIQVKVSGADHFTPEDVARVQRVAADIAHQTGLVAEVTMGSSPGNVLVHVPASNGHPAFGWVQEQWIHKNAGVTTVQQTEFGYSAFIGFVLVVAMLYTVATGLAGVSARRRNLGIAAAVGWPRHALRNTAMLEQVYLAAGAGLLAMLAAAYAKVPPGRVALTFGAALLIYLPALLAVGRAAAATSPGDAMRYGDTAPARRVLPGTGPWALALATLVGRLGRSLLTIAAIALPTALLFVLVFVSQQLRGLLYTTLAGQYTLLKVGPLQYVAAIIALVMAGITAFDLVRQNAIDHRHERALLHALGWPRSWIGLTMVAEGGLLGVAAGVLGSLFGLVVLGALFGAGTLHTTFYALLVALLPVLLGLMAGAAGALLELRSWNRAGLAGVGSTQVAGRGVWLISAATLAVVVLLTATLMLPGLVKRAAVTQAQNVRPEDKALAGITAAMAVQNQALHSGDDSAFMRTVDADALEFRAEQQHWLEDAAGWRKAGLGNESTRTAQGVALLGTNTARVTVQVALAAKQGTQRYVSDEIWVRMPDQSWRLHGPDMAVWADGGITVWYPKSHPTTLAEQVAQRVRESMDQYKQQLHWTISEPVVIQIFPDGHALMESVGPTFASLPVQLPAWTEQGEPLRAISRSFSAPYVLAYKWVMDQSHNHAGEWLREALVYDALRRLQGHSWQREVQAQRQQGVILPQQLPELHPLTMQTSAESSHLQDAEILLAAYLQQRYGPDTMNKVLARLAAEPTDPRMTGPATFAERTQKSIAAIEQATGRTWQQINADYQQWFNQQP